jgi:hypothetical protein
MLKAYLQHNINTSPTLRLPMKNYTQPTASKLAKQFDNDLKKILLADLNVFKVKSQRSTTSVVQLNLISAA